jgi:hypothetical protein
VGRRAWRSGLISCGLFEKLSPETLYANLFSDGNHQIFQIRSEIQSKFGCGVP